MSQNTGKIIVPIIDLTSDELHQKYLSKKDIDAKYKLLGLKTELLKTIELIDKLTENSHSISDIKILDSHQLIISFNNPDTYTKCIDQSIIYKLEQEPIQFIEELGNFANIIGDDENDTDAIIKRLHKITDTSVIEASDTDDNSVYSSESDPDLEADLDADSNSESNSESENIGNIIEEYGDNDIE